MERDVYGKKAGKGALIQWEKSATLGVSQDQTLFVLKATEQDLPTEASASLRARQRQRADITLPCVITNAKSLKVFHCTTETELAQPLKARDYKDPLVVVYDIADGRKDGTDGNSSKKTYTKRM